MHSSPLCSTYVRSGALAQLQGLGVYKLWRRLMDTKQRQL